MVLTGFCVSEHLGSLGEIIRCISHLPVAAIEYLDQEELTEDIPWLMALESEPTVVGEVW